MHLRLKYELPTLRLMHAYEVRPRNDHRGGVDLISDALPFGRLLYGRPNGQQCNRMRAALWPLTSCRDPRLRSRWQRDRDARA
jgi:hypothetical protein